MPRLKCYTTVTNDIKKYIEKDLSKTNFLSFNKYISHYLSLYADGIIKEPSDDIMIKLTRDMNDSHVLKLNNLSFDLVDDDIKLFHRLMRIHNRNMRYEGRNFIICLYNHLKTNK